MTLLWVALGAAIGAPLRYLVDRWLTSGRRWPWGTFVVNVAGSFLLAGLTAVPVGPTASAVVGAGFCGALTTYSTFGAETLRLLRDERWRGLAYAAASLVMGLSAAYAGLAITRSFM
ncbi:CrcB family protein [Mycobacterium sp. MYCO198283]|uniref:fluoride efflux transporter FluC n=1 Tax=Mycobacterium sp. MYCO198283 TaxID=2883505 RepID=UPI001E2D82E5|nr:CrcB family protein [Mycobacterium sp. MYCO198283]MCG5434309.1 CrcB family protein [Mycobacterium sp. MYCO198283]